MAEEDLAVMARKPWWRDRWISGLAAVAIALAGMTYALRMMDNTMLSKLPLTTLAGKTTDLPTLAAGKPVVVNLWATWCPPCRLELPFLAAAQRQEAGINFVFVDQGEDAVTVERYLGAARLGIDNVLLDTGTRLGREIGSTALPVTLFYDSGGRMVDTHVGALSPSLLAGKLSRLR
ncbi:MAG: TlpA family protein disulfide reductase [Burkholderiales bacterium]|nr:TlpA family protein disulfide reductase [Burkholderiales bacterium]